MIHVCVGKKDQIGPRQLVTMQCRRNKSLDTHRHGTNLDANFVAEHGIGDDRKAVDLKQYTTVAKPRRVKPGIGPGPGIRAMRRGHNVTRTLLRNLSNYSGCNSQNARRLA